MEGPLPRFALMQMTSFSSPILSGASIYDVQRYFGLFDPCPPYLYIITEPPFLLSAFWVPSSPLPTSRDVIYGKPPYIFYLMFQVHLQDGVFTSLPFALYCFPLLWKLDF